MRKMHTIEKRAHGEWDSVHSQYVLDKPIEENKIYLIMITSDDGVETTSALLCTYRTTNTHIDWVARDVYSTNILNYLIIPRGDRLSFAKYTDASDSLQPFGDEYTVDVYEVI